MHLTLRIQGDTPGSLLQGLLAAAEDIRRSQKHSGQVQLSQARQHWFAHWKFDDVDAPLDFTQAKAASGMKPLELAMAEAEARWHGQKARGVA